MTRTTADDKVRDKSDHDEQTEADDQHLRPDGRRGPRSRAGAAQERDPRAENLWRHFVAIKSYCRQ